MEPKKMTKAEAIATAKPYFEAHKGVDELATIGDGRYFPVKSAGKESATAEQDFKAHVKRTKSTTEWRITRAEAEKATASKKEEGK